MPVIPRTVSNTISNALIRRPLSNSCDPGRLYATGRGFSASRWYMITGNWVPEWKSPDQGKEREMNERIFIGTAPMALVVALTATLAFSQAPAGGPQSPGWFLQGTAPDPGGRLAVGPGGRVIPAALGNRGGLLAACAEDSAKFCSGQTGIGARACLAQSTEKLSAGCKAAVAALPPLADSCY